jgi:hypothetical protein
VLPQREVVRSDGVAAEFPPHCQVLAQVRLNVAEELIGCHGATSGINPSRSKAYSRSRPGGGGMAYGLAELVALSPSMSATVSIGAPEAIKSLPNFLRMEWKPQRSPPASNSTKSKCLPNIWGLRKNEFNIPIYAIFVLQSFTIIYF